MTFCPYCGVRADIDLRQIHFRDLGQDASMPCPQCETALGVIEFDTVPKIRIERCTTCLGMFFNPGEMEALLDAQTNPLVWLDPARLNQIAEDFQQEREIFYRRCPMCSERMSHLNFGGQSGVILDRCGTHGVWLEGSKLRWLTEWWRAGGKLIYQQNEAKRAKNMYGTPSLLSRKPTPGSISCQPDETPSWTWTNPTHPTDLPEVIITAIGGILSSMVD